MTLTVRETVLRLVRAYPALHVREVERQLGLSSKLADHHLASLEAEGRVRRVEEAGFTRFLDAETAARMAEDELALLLLARRGPALRIMLLLLAEGEARPGALAEALGLAKASTSYHLKALAEAGVVEARQEGRERRYRLRDPERVRETLGRHPPLPAEIDDFARVWADLYG